MHMYLYFNKMYLSIIHSFIVASMRCRPTGHIVHIRTQIPPVQSSPGKLPTGKLPTRTTNPRTTSPLKITPQVDNPLPLGQFPLPRSNKDNHFRGQLPPEINPCSSEENKSVIFSPRGSRSPRTLQGQLPPITQGGGDFPGGNFKKEICPRVLIFLRRRCPGGGGGV